MESNPKLTRITIASCCIAILVGPRFYLLRSINRSVQEASAVWEYFWPDEPQTPPEKRYEPWCCRADEPEPQDDELQGGAHIFYAANAEVFEPLLHSVLSLGRALEPGGRPVTVHLVVPQEDLARAILLQDCVAAEGLQIALELHELRDHLGALPAKARARVRVPLAFVKLHMHEYLPFVPRVLWLDADTIVRTDLRRLYFRRLRNSLALSCHTGSKEVARASHMQEFRLRVPELSSCYLNTGILLVDLVRWRAQGLSETLRTLMVRPDVYMAIHYRLNMDQTLFNLHFTPSTVDVLDQRWNVLHVGRDPEPIPRCCEAKARILHWAWDGKPWKDGGRHVHLYREHAPRLHCELRPNESAV